MNKKQLIVVWVIGIISFIAGACYAEKLPLPDVELESGWERIYIKNVGNLDIPPVMEVQAGAYKDFVGKVGNKLGFVYDATRIVIQPKGINEFNQSAFQKYARVIVETTIGNKGDFKNLDIESLPQSDIDELSSLYKNNIPTGAGLRVIEFYPVKLKKISGMSAMHLCYKRQHNENPIVLANQYIFFNGDRIHTLTMSYRLSEEDYWEPYFDKILKSFRITNIQNTITDKEKAMQIVFGDNWILALVLSVVLTWGWGLFIPLLIRFAIARKPISKVSAIVIVSILWVVNIIIFTALESKSKTHMALFLVAWASYTILNKGYKRNK